MMLRGVLGGLVALSLALPSSAAAQSAVDTRPDLSVTVVAAPHPVPAGTPVTYTVTVRNGQGGGFFATANGVRVVHNLPSGIGFQSATGDRGFTCAFAPPAVTCTGGTLPSQAAATINVVGMAYPSGFPRVSTTTVDPLNAIDERNEGNNGAAVTVTVGLPDLTAGVEYATRSVCVLRFPNGYCYRFATVLDRTITVNNAGLADAAPVVVDIDIAWLSYGNNSPWISDPPGWYCAETANESYSHRWRCTTSSMPAGASAEFVAMHFTPPTSGIVTEVHVDPQVAVLESNEGNNFVSK
jgi:uncharacterized repeat protein (TIGR01451 family)